MTTFGGYGVASEYHVERKWKEARLFRTAPLSNNLVLAQIAQHAARYAPILPRQASMSASQHRSNGKLPATEALADFVLGGRVDDHTLRLATSAVLDTVAVTIAGSGEPGPSRLQKALEPVHGPLSSRLLWSAASFNRFDAALITGTASHVLDYDDVSMLSVCHPSAPVLSALLNLRSWDNLDGRELIEAFVIGTEVLIRLGQAMGFRHYALGFHATATLGTVAAAAACARLLRLSPIQTRHALAIAASMSSGLQVNFGSMVKSLHVGIAASNGLRAVQLAAAGIEGANEVLSGSGFIRAFSGDEKFSVAGHTPSGGALCAR